MGVFNIRAVSRAGLLCMASALFAAGPSIAWGVDLDSQVSFDVPAGTLSQALIDFSKQAHVQVLSSGARTKYASTDGLTGTFTIRDALNRLLRSSGLRFKSVGADAVAIEMTTNTGARNSDTTSVTDDTHPVVLTRVAMATASDSSPPAAEATDQANGFQLSEIVVTAEKRSSTADKTPISITAVSGQDMLDRGITEFSTLAAETPGVSLKTAGPGQTEFEIRGVTSSGGNSPTVGFYLDDTPLTSPAAAQNGKVVIDPSLYDLDRVEVLRGPQGTLYGSSSEGGTIRLITNQPKLNEFEGSGQSTLSGTDGGGFNHAENGMLNLPLINDVLALRVVGSQASTSGWIDRIVVGDFPPATTTVQPGDTRGNVLAAPVLADYKQSNAETLKGGRVSLLWKPTDQLTITPSVFFQVINQDGPSDYDSSPGTLAHYQPFDIAEPYSDSITINALNVNYKFDGFDLTSATSYWHRESRMIQDNSENIPSSPGGFGVTTSSASYYGPDGTGPIYALETDPSKQFSQEIRAASTGSGPWVWLFGAYYSRFQSQWQLNTDVPNPAAFGSTTPNIFTIDQPTVIKQDALFGETTYSPTDKLHLTGGLRYYHYDSQLDMVFSGLGSPTGNNTAITQNIVQTNSGANPKADISYDIDENALIYGSVARGFRPGGGNQPLPSSGPSPIAPALHSALVALGYPNGVAPISYGPDSIWSYEIGEKAKFFANRLRVNASVYFEDWRHIQLEELPFGYPLFDNANTAHIYGSEVEVEGAATKNLTLGASAGYTHATLAETEHGFVAGQRLTDVPEVTGTVSISYHADLSTKYEFKSRLEDSYVGSRVGLGTAFGLINQTEAPLPSYNLANFRAGISSKDGWSAALFANNLTNKHAYLEDVAQLGLPNASYNRVATNQPRTIGIDLNYHF
jgi:iron complex outermembrane receptor protein